MTNEFRIGDMKFRRTTNGGVVVSVLADSGIDAPIKSTTFIPAKDWCGVLANMAKRGGDHRDTWADAMQFHHSKR